jgi:DnaJ-class molecular chaperone
MSIEELSKISPEVFAQKCPVCNGHTTVNFGRKVCEACKGKGYLILPVKRINTEEEEEKNGHKQVF